MDAEQALNAYHKAMRRGDTSRALAIEVEYGLAGYPPELVSIGLRAIALGADPYDAIEEQCNVQR